MTLNNTNSAKEPLVEMPIKSEKEDLLDTFGFQETFINYIEESKTPVTIALQGEWGKGKTSMMNLVALRLCGKNFSISKSNAALPYHGVFINTWQFALSGGTPDQVTISILCSIINQLSELVPKEKSEKTKEALLNLAYNYGPEMLERIGSQLGRYSFISNIIAKTLIFIRNSKNKANKDPQIKQLKDSIKKLIDEILEKDNIKKGIIFFIDDLDRIDAELAVKILENFKNIFDFNHCIFVMAIDFDIIIKGLEPKLGKYSPSNSKKFEYYFAKFVQISLSIPDYIYIQNFMIEIIMSTGLFNEKDDKDELRPYINLLCDVITSSNKANPRYMKQFAKKIEFLVSYNKTIARNTITSDKIEMRALIVIIAYLQSAFSNIYNYLSSNQDFKSWTNDKANHDNIVAIDLNKLNIEDKDDLTQMEEWQQVLFRLCLLDLPSLSINRFSCFINLFDTIDNTIKELVDNTNSTRVLDPQNYLVNPPLKQAINLANIVKNNNTAQQ